MSIVLKDNEIVFAKIRETAIIPSKKLEDAGYDLYANFEEDYFVFEPFETILETYELNDDVYELNDALGFSAQPIESYPFITLITGVLIGSLKWYVPAPAAIAW